MPSLQTITTKHWGKVDKAALHKLVIHGHVNIKDLFYENINAIQAEYFPHRTVHSCFSGAFNLEEGLIGARQGKMRICYFLNIYLFIYGKSVQ